MADLVDDGVIRTTFCEHFGKITAANLKRADTLIESGKAKEKIILEGFCGGSRRYGEMVLGTPSYPF